MKVSDWLSEQGFADYIDEFEVNGVDEELLLELTNDDLKDLGVSRLADRKRILKAIAQLQLQQKHPAQKNWPHQVSQASENGERRHVTVLFADLAGFTTLSAQLDPEDLHNLLNSLYETLDPVIEKYGGTVDKHLGDGVMALFGAPIAHGDDPLRALRTAFDIHSAMDRLSLQQDRELAVHIGVAMGEVIAGGLGREGHKEYTVIGDSVNLASRLDSLADKGETIIDPAVYSAVQDYVHCQDLGPTRIKGLSQAINLWKAKYFLAGEGIRKTAFVGRSGELRQVETVLRTCLADRAGQLVLIRGEAGIGKTRLLEEIEKKSQRMGFSPYKALILDFGVSKGQDAIASLLHGFNKEGELAALFPPDQQPFLRDLLGQEQRPADTQIYQNLDNSQRQKGKELVLSQILQTKAEQCPRVLIVEDVHWADKATLDSLCHMVMAIRRLAVTLVMSSRIEGNPISASWCNRGQHNGTKSCASITLDLGPLKEQEVVEFSKAFATGQDAAFDKCVERAEGNPLFLEQLFRNAIEANDQSVPASIQSLILSRADRLAARDKQALQAASVIGQRFALEALQYLIDDLKYDGKALIDHQMIRPIGDHYLFCHALLQESIYLSLLKKHRTQFHLQAASYYQLQDKLLYAEHLGRADDPCAGQAYLAAANHLIQQYQFDKALPALDKGLSFATTAMDRYLLSKYKAQTLRELGDIQASITTFKQALALAPCPAEQAHLWTEIATGLRIADLYSEALDALATAAELLKDVDDLETRANIHHMRGNIYFPMGRIEECELEHQKSLRLAQESGSITLQADALSGMADADYMSGKMASAYQDFVHCVEAAEQAGLRNVAAVNRSMVGFSRFYLLELPQALADGQQAVRDAQSIFFQRAELLGETISAMVCFEQTDFDQAAKHIQQAYELSIVLGAPRFEAQALMYKARIAQALADGEQANELLQHAFSVSEQIGHGFAGPRIMAAIALATCDEAQMVQALRDGEKMIAGGSVGHNPLFFYPMAIEASLHWQRRDLLEYYCEQFRCYTAAEPLPWSDFFIDLGQWGINQEQVAFEALLARATNAGLTRIQSVVTMLGTGR